MTLIDIVNFSLKTYYPTMIETWNQKSYNDVLNDVRWFFLINKLFAEKNQ